MNENILKQALEQALDESYNEMIDQDIPDYDFSPEFKARMEGLILSQQTQPEKKRSRMLWFTAMAAAAALLAVTIGLNNSARPSLNHDRQQDIISETTAANTTSVTTGTDTTGTSAAVTETHTTIAAASSSKKVSDTTISTGTSVSAKPDQTPQTTAVKGTSERNVSSALSRTVTSAAVSASVSVTGITTTVTDASVDPPTERSFYMEKISVFLAALMVANSATAATNLSNANDIKIDTSSPFVYSYYYNEGDQLSFIPELHKDESRLDFNKDGKFDINDIYIYYLFYNGVDLKEPENFDFSAVTPENGETDRCSYSFEQIAEYFATYYTIKPEYIDPEPFIEFFTENVSPDYINDMGYHCNLLRSNFTKELAADTARVYQFYDIFRDMTANNNVDLDVSGNGVFDFDDIYYFSIFDHAMMNDHIFSDHDRAENFLNAPVIEEEIPSDIIQRCAEVVKQYECNDIYPMDYSVHCYMLQYYLEDHPFDPAYTDKEFYSETYPELEEKYEPSFFLLIDIRPMQYNLGYGSNAMRYYYPERSEENLIKEYETFKKQVDSGKRTVPDLNIDGRITAADYCLSDRLFDDYRYSKDIPFAQEYRVIFLNDFDLNDNGMSADINDVAIYQMYVGEMLGMDREGLYQVSRQYYIDDPEFDPVQTGKVESTSCDEEKALSYDEYLEEISEGKNIAPDINNDGKITIEDYVFADITQSSKGLGTDHRLSIVPEEAKNFYLHECDFDKDGLFATYNDLDLVRHYIAEILGITEEFDEISNKAKYDYDIENYILKKMYYLEEEYVSQFDDQLSDHEKTLKAQFKPEFAEKFTVEELDIIDVDTDDDEYVWDHRDEIQGNITAAQKKMLDTSLNGYIEPEDLVIAKALYENYFIDRTDYSSYEKLLTKERKDNFYSNFDFNGNGISGDFADVEWAELLYQEILGLEEVESAYRKNNNVSVPLDENVSQGTQKRNGDANVSGTTDISDSVLIMQSFANPDKYKLTDKGKFNGDLNATGDGITPKDALAIQQLLLHKTIV